MNKRIDQLLVKAGAVFGGEGVVYDTFDPKKFAELIVRECLYQVADVRIENNFEPVGDAALVQALAGIKKYFGVEE
jgi:hypothetical protein